MTAETAWLLAIVAIVIAAAIGFFAGRRAGAGTARIAELEAEVKRQQDRSDDYRKEVAAHFDKTATLFVSMAGSYKQMFEHLSSGYERLSPGSARETLQQRVDVLLVGDGREGVDDKEVTTGAGIAASAAAAAAAAAAAPTATAAVGSDTSGAAKTPAGREATSSTVVAAVKSEADPMAAVGIVDSDTDRETVSDTPAGTDATTTTDETPTRAATDSEDLLVEPITPVPASPEAPGEVQFAPDLAPESPADEIRRDALAPAGDPLAEEAVGGDRAASRDGIK